MELIIIFGLFIFVEIIYILSKNIKRKSIRRRILNMRNVMFALFIFAKINE